MASIDKRPNGRYRTRWREYPGGPQKTRHFDRKSDAQQFLDGGHLVDGLARSLSHEDWDKVARQFFLTEEGGRNA